MRAHNQSESVSESEHVVVVWGHHQIRTRPKIIRQTICVAPKEKSKSSKMLFNNLICHNLETFIKVQNKNQNHRESLSRIESRDDDESESRNGAMGNTHSRITRLINGYLSERRAGT